MMNFISIIIFGVPSFVAGYIFAYMKRGFEIGIELAQKAMDRA